MPNRISTFQCHTQLQNTAQELHVQENDSKTIPISIPIPMSSIHEANDCDVDRSTINEKQRGHARKLAEDLKGMVNDILEEMGEASPFHDVTQRVSEVMEMEMEMGAETKRMDAFGDGDGRGDVKKMEPSFLDSIADEVGAAAFVDVLQAVPFGAVFAFTDVLRELYTLIQQYGQQYMAHDLTQRYFQGAEDRILHAHCKATSPSPSPSPSLTPSQRSLR